MWYMPYVRVRRAVVIYALLVAAITLIAVAIRYWPGAVHFDLGEQARLDRFQIDLAMLVSGAAALVAGLATVLGLNLAAENDGHLEVAWTKPVSRDGYALGVFAVDIGAIAACIVITMFCGAIVADVYLGHQAIGFGDVHGLVHALAFCGLPLLIYSWITALSASLKRNRATVAGLFWPLMIAIAASGFIPIPVIHVISTAINTFNPIDIYSSQTSHGPQTSTWTYLSGWAIGALLLYAAMVQWRRIEA